MKFKGELHSKEILGSIALWRAPEGYFSEYILQIYDMEKKDKFFTAVFILHQCYIRLVWSV
jgi:hypothetical protein